jgi:hypothetical protein
MLPVLLFHVRKIEGDCRILGPALWRLLVWFGPQGVGHVCRNIRTLHNFAPPATDEEIRASATQFVRKLSGFTRPSKANEVAFNRAVDKVTAAAHELLDSLKTNAPPRDREVEAAKARARAADRFASPARGGA